MKKIVVTQDLGLTREDQNNLSQLGEVVYYNNLSSSPEEWLERCQGFDIICTGKFGLKSDKLYQLKDVYLSLPFVGVGFLDIEKMRERNITASNTPGCNKEAVSEWVIAMILNLFRKFPHYINNLELPIGEIPQQDKGLRGKNITILGRGNIGSRVGKICEALEMRVRYFTKADNLLESIKDADIIVDALALNQDTTGMLDRDFFNSFKPGAYFVTVTSSQIYDQEAMFEALDSKILGGVGIDCGSIQVGDVKDPLFIRMAKHSRVLATPHIAYNTDVTNYQSGKMMIDNIKAYIKGRPINLIY